VLIEETKEEQKNMEAEAIIFALISPRNGYTQHERFIPESAEFQPFDLGALRHLYSAKDNSS
jgi:hypothetical protein